MIMRFFGLILTIILGLCVSMSAWSAVVITGTRVIYPADNKEVNIFLNNIAKEPALVQAWVDSDESTVSTDKPIPFILTPPIFRMEGGKTQTLRLIYTKEPLPKDRESLFYFNLLDIPPKPKGEDAPENYLQIAVSSRLKLFFRPKNLTPSVSEAPKKLELTLQNQKLTIHNPTPYYITINSVHLLTHQKDENPVVLDDVPMIKPFGQQIVDIQNNADNRSFTHTDIEVINDYGGTSKVSVNLK